VTSLIREKGAQRKRRDKSAGSWECKRASRWRAG
jgi:hypothetical protein